MGQGQKPWNQSKEKDAKPPQVEAEKHPDEVAAQEDDGQKFAEVLKLVTNGSIEIEPEAPKNAVERSGPKRVWWLGVKEGSPTQNITIGGVTFMAFTDYLVDGPDGSAVRRHEHGRLEELTDYQVQRILNAVRFKRIVADGEGRGVQDINDRYYYPSPEHHMVGWHLYLVPHNKNLPSDYRDRKKAPSLTPRPKDRVFPKAGWEF